MIGAKVGTGGSAGYEYLKHIMAKQQAFADIKNLSTFLIPQSMLPGIPEGCQQLMQLVYGQGGK